MMHKAKPRAKGFSLGLIAFFTFFIFAYLTESFAATSSSWSGKPSWMTSGSSRGGDGESRRRSSYRGSEEIAPPFAPNSHNLSVDVGQVFLLGDLGSSYNDSIGSRLHYTYGVSDLFGFDASFGYSSHSSGRMSMTTALAGMRMNVSWYDKVIPHFNFGLGFFRPSYDIRVNNIRNSISPVLFGFHLGPGVTLELTKRMYFGASLTFHNMFGTETVLSDGSQHDVGGAYTSFFLSAGMTF